MNVYLSTTITLKGATIGMPVHVARYVKIYDKIPNDFEEKKNAIVLYQSVAWEYQIINKYMIVGKLLKFAS